MANHQFPTSALDEAGARLFEDFAFGFAGVASVCLQGTEPVAIQGEAVAFESVHMFLMKVRA